MKTTIGKHIIIDGYCKNKKLDSIEGIYDFLIEAVNTVNMTILMPPVVVKFPYNQDLLLKVYKEYSENNMKHTDMYKDIEKYIINTKGQMSGFSGTIILMESHLAIHTFPEIKYSNEENTLFFSLDLYSCKTFDENNFLNYLKDHCGFIEGNCVLMDRCIEDFEIKKYKI